MENFCTHLTLYFFCRDGQSLSEAVPLYDEESVFINHVGKNLRTKVALKRTKFCALVRVFDTHKPRIHQGLRDISALLFVNIC